jgi:endonuclease III
VKPRDLARRIFDALERHYPDADTELTYRTPFELLVATILSAQSTDQRVNLVTPALFERYPDARALATANPEDIEPLIVSTGFFRQKSRSIVGMAQALVASHGGEVPADMDALVKLPGVGRKTANVVLGHALGVPGFPVDRHVLRVANRLGLVTSDDPERVETVLCALLPAGEWTRGSDTLILHGRRICRPTSPLCGRCNARKDCRFYAAGGSAKGERSAHARGAAAGKVRAEAGTRTTRPRAAKRSSSPPPKAAPSAGRGKRSK